jgi:hypothetical protein
MRDQPPAFYACPQATTAPRAQSKLPNFALKLNDQGAMENNDYAFLPFRGRLLSGSSPASAGDATDACSL